MPMNMNNFNRTIRNNDNTHDVLFKDYAALRPVGGRDNAAEYYETKISIDMSGSMRTPMEGTKSRFDEIKEALLHHLRSLMKDELWSAYGHVSILVFGDNCTRQILEKTPVCELDLQSLQRDLDAIHPRGNTPMGRALVEAMGQLRDNHKQAVAKGMNAYQPILVLFTDGEANDDMSEAFRMADTLLDDDKLVLLPVHISGCEKGIETLQRLVAKDPSGESVSVLNNHSDVLSFFKYLKKTQQILHDTDPNRVEMARRAARLGYMRRKGE